MAEENQNTEMEDILSSIKNILEEDSAGHPQESAAEEVDVIDNLLNSSTEVDDVLELSPDMRVEQASVETAFDAAEDVDISLPEVDDASGVGIGIEDETSDSVFDATSDTRQDDNIFETVPAFEDKSEPYFEKNEAEESITVSDPSADNTDDIFADLTNDAEATVLDEIVTEAQPEAAPVIEEIAAEPVSVSSLADTETFADVFPVEDNTPADDFVIDAVSEPTISEVSETENTIETEIAPVTIFEPEAAEIAPVAESVAEPETFVSEEVVPVVEETVSVVEQEDQKTDAVDVSAGIISNFAKMFAKEEPAPVVEQPVQQLEITETGNTAKTLEQFVLDSVVKVIGSEISRQWNDGAVFSSFAEAEIKRQTREWLNDNLPSLVEKVVKKEIERVIEKVGS